MFHIRLGGCLECVIDRTDSDSEIDIQIEPANPFQVFFGFGVTIVYSFYPYLIVQYRKYRV